ncbi:MAG TPA: KilA-N domain-containing protein [Clostridia bacterium]|nr:KilA-N domain-containing protein [Clostridia bacterium]
MSKPKKSTIEVQGTPITILSKEHGDYISLTDMVRNFEGGSALIEQWLKNKDTVLFLGVWERIHNPGFNSLEFEGIRNEAGRNSFFLSAKAWIERTRAKGLVASAGRYGGTFAHKDIAFEFGSWLSPEFKLYLIKEFQRLKDDENRRLSLAWNLNRTLSKLNYRIHTDAVKAHLVPPEVTPAQAAITYASEADVLNVSLFGQTAKQWRDANPKLDGNMRDHATIEQLLVLANIEGMNAEFIHMALPQPDRLKRLNQIAIRQMQTLTVTTALRQLEPPKDRKD